MQVNQLPDHKNDAAVINDTIINLLMRARAISQSALELEGNNRHAHHSNLFGILLALDDYLEQIHAVCVSVDKKMPIP